MATLAELLAWSRDPGAAASRSALGDVPCLVVDAGGQSQDLPERVARWLDVVACPVLAVGERTSALADACDVHVPDAAAAAPLLRSIQRTPIAAAVVVQVLRTVPRASLADALLAESLAYSTLQAGPEFARWRAQHRPGPPDHSDEGPAVLAQREGGEMTLLLNRPSRRNAMSVEMRDALIEALQLALTDDSLVSIRIEGRGRCFSTGGDLDEFGSAPDPATAHVVRSLALPGRLLAECADRCAVRLHGACIGSGIEFPAFASSIEASPDAWFQLPELRYGLIPGAGGCVSLSRRIGRQRVAWMALSGQRVNAQTALRWGLVDAIG
jgi:enoyl-CoA hydratase/carnithine racemase